MEAPGRDEIRFQEDDNYLIIWWKSKMFVNLPKKNFPQQPGSIFSLEQVLYDQLTSNDQFLYDLIAQLRREARGE